MSDKLIKQIPNRKTLQNYSIPLNFNFFGVQFESLDLFSWKLLLQNKIYATIPKHHRFFYKTNDLYNYNTKIKLNFLDSLTFSFYPLLSNLHFININKTFFSPILQSILKQSQKFVKSCLIKKEKQKGLFFVFSLNQFRILPLDKKEKTLKITRESRSTFLHLIFKPIKKQKLKFTPQVENARTAVFLRSPKVILKTLKVF